MPKMNGLELIKEIKDRKLNIKCINLSGYNDFKYVKEAIKLGIENYLLKPVDIDELTSTLINTVSKLETELYEITVNCQDINIIRDNILYRMVTNDINEDELLERAQLLDINLKSGAFSIAILKIDYETNDKNQIDDKSISRFAVYDICSEFVCSDARGTVFCNLDRDIVVLFYAPSSNVELRITLEKCIESINKFLNTNVL